jgi:transposase
MVPQTPPPETPSYEELFERVARLERLLSEKDRRIAELERLLEQSRRGGKRQAAPFSKGSAKDSPKRPGRKPGMRYGRQATRPVPAKIDQHILVGCPLFCPHYDGEVRVTGKTDQYQRELSRPRAVTRHFEIHVGRCTACGRTVQERHRLQTWDAKEVGTVQLGPQLIAMAAHMNKVEGLSYGRVCGLLERLFGVTVSRSGLARSLGRLAERGEPSYEILKAQLKAAPVVYPDETGWKIGGRSAWLHGATDGAATTVYTIEAGRSYPEAAELLGAGYAGAIASDGWAPYRKFERASRQACLGHLLRRCNEMLEAARGGSARLPRAVKATLKRAFVVRDLRDEGALSPRRLRRQRAELESDVGRLLVGRYRDPENRRLVKHIEALQPDLFRFLEQPGLEGTNWPAETELRYAVINRKTCGGGNRTSRGARTQSVLMTIARTARKRHLDGVRILADLLRAQHEIVHPALLIPSG